MICINKKKRYINQKEIDELNKRNNNLIIVNNNIYDITPMIDSHPGGKKCLLKKIGTDCTSDLNFHSKQTQKLLKKFYIGKFKK